MKNKYHNKMPDVRDPFNALDTLKEKMQEQLGQNGISMTWEQSEYCHKTFIVWLHHNNATYEYNLRFYPEFYAMSASNNSPDGLTKVMRDKFDAVIYM